MVVNWTRPNIPGNLSHHTSLTSYICLNLSRSLSFYLKFRLSPLLSLSLSLCLSADLALPIFIYTHVSFLYGTKSDDDGWIAFILYGCL